MGKCFGQVFARSPLICLCSGCRPDWFQLGVPLAGSCCQVLFPFLTHFGPSALIEQLIPMAAQRGSAGVGPPRKLEKGGVLLSRHAVSTVLNWAVMPVGASCTGGHEPSCSLTF